MSTHLDEFERSLVTASRALYAEAEHAHVTAPHSDRRRAPNRWRVIRRVRHLTAALQLALALSTLTALAAGATFAYIVLSTDQAKTLASIDCNVTHNSQAILDTITGNPIVDCALAWPSATAGRAAAPPLTAWVLANNTKVAVVRPTRWGPPRRIGGVAWRRLPAGWTVNLSVVELTDQLNDISTRLSPAPLTAAGGPPCSYARNDVHIVRALLEADGLSSWRVLVTPANRTGSVSDGCRLTTPNIDGAARTVQLLQSVPAQPFHASPQQRNDFKKAALANVQLAALAKSVNGTLATRCESVNDAAALWTVKARAAGLAPTSLAYFRAVNAANPVPLRLALDYYTLAKQPASQHTGSCAHILVIRGGAGNLTVYAARITP